MAELTIPEPSDGRALYWAATGTGEFPVVMVRDDTLRREWTTDPEARWFEANSGGEPMTWDEMCEHSDREGYPLAEAVRMVPEAEVARAAAAAGITPVGEHLMELGGYCRTHGVRHSPEEIARAEDRLAKEESCGD